VIDLEVLAKTPEEVAALTRPEREQRVFDLMDESYRILDHGIDTLILADDRKVAAVVALFSGGNDSTVLAHLFRDRITHAAHANTTIGVEQTREFVRNTCDEWGVPLIERSAPRLEDQYRALVLDRGFPGPAMHFKMFTRLKERALEQVRRELVAKPFKERVVFLAGRRRTESKRRANVPEFGRKGSTVWISPMVNWTKMDMNTYRLLSGDVPRNQVADVLHMSGECLCGAFASAGEREQLEEWFPGTMLEIRELEALIADRDDILDYRKTWGWGADPEVLKAAKKKDRTPSKQSGILCQSCDDKWEQMEAASCDPAA
jgi:3'-phosphoadenosine 5'-phosphosulfate sulfotransferase (PAPS reductase)/FAD synthetase